MSCHTTQIHETIVCKLDRHTSQELLINLNHQLCDWYKLEHYLPSYSSPQVIAVGRTINAELKTVAKLCREHKVPLLIVLETMESRDLCNLTDDLDFALTTSASLSNLEPWLTYAGLLRSQHSLLTERATEAESKLIERKQIERAKGIIMTLHKVNEEMAYQALQKSAMSSSRSLAQMANLVIQQTQEGRTQNRA